jgi:hypothetical protein
MLDVVASLSRHARRAHRSFFARPWWGLLVFFIAIGVAYSPGLLTVFNLGTDFDALALKSEHFLFHNEAVHLLSIARPIAALLSNLPVLFVRSPEDFRWVHLVSLLTVCVLGWQMIRTCIGRLYISVWDAVAVTLATFLGLAFIYAVFEATAWASHLFTTFLAFLAYGMLGRSNVRTLSFLGYVVRRDYRALFNQLPIYCSSRSVWVSCLVFQCALYCYPPFALLIVVFPVITVLFSRAPAAYARLIVVRDVAFVLVNVILFFLSTALLYLPIVRLFTAKGTGQADAYESDLVANLYAGHQFLYNTDSSAIAYRLGYLMRVSADLWFMPQAHMYIVTAGVLLLALLAAGSNIVAASFDSRQVTTEAYSRIFTLFVLCTCFLMAASPILASAGGFTSYRTSVGTTAITAIIFICAVRTMGERLWRMTGRSSSTAVAAAGGVAMAFVVGAAFAANNYANYAVMKLGRNEYHYFAQIVRKAIDNKSKAIVLIDRRPWNGPEGYRPWPVFDEGGRAVPPFELACFSSFCLQTGQIVRVISAQLGLPEKAMEIVATRGDEPVPGLTCEMIETPFASYPLNTSKRSIELIDRYRSLGPLTCVIVSAVWHDLGIDLSVDKTFAAARSNIPTD